jgi:hypothetical protein
MTLAIDLLILKNTLFPSQNKNAMNFLHCILVWAWKDFPEGIAL